MPIWYDYGTATEPNHGGWEVVCSQSGCDSHAKVWDANKRLTADQALAEMRKQGLNFIKWGEVILCPTHSDVSDELFPY